MKLIKMFFTIKKYKNCSLSLSGKYLIIHFGGLFDIENEKYYRWNNYCPEFIEEDKETILIYQGRDAFAFDKKLKIFPKDIVNETKFKTIKQNMFDKRCTEYLIIYKDNVLNENIDHWNAFYKKFLYRRNFTYYKRKIIIYKRFDECSFSLEVNKNYNCLF